MMFSGIDSSWVPRAQVSSSAGGRKSGSAIQPSTPAIITCTASAAAGRRARHLKGNGVGHEHLGLFHLLGGRVRTSGKRMDDDPIRQAGSLDGLDVGRGR